MDINQKIGVLEFRNYLLKPGMTDRFCDYFNDHFVNPMSNLGGHTLGQFRLKGVNDRFIWIRGFKDMQTRVKFLNEFYVDSQEWKKFGPGANDMMINSDNVFLLRPLNETGKAINSNELEIDDGIVVADFYIANTRLEAAIDFFNTKYIPFIKTQGVDNITAWISELTENDFPRLPAFQDKNLLVTITQFKSESDFQSAIKRIESSNPELRVAMLEIITTQNRMVLYPTIHSK